MAFNLVELVTAGDEENAFDQPCKFGHRVDGHAVYCRNDAWTDGPRKCRRTWYSGGEIKDEDCPGFQPNAEFKGALNPTARDGQTCSKCSGSKLIPGREGTVETCPLCMGDGIEPKPIKLSQFAQDTLELCCLHSGKSQGQFENQVRMVEKKSQMDDIFKLEELGLIQVRSVNYAKDVRGVLYKMTMKGDAVMRANWKDAKH